MPDDIDISALIARAESALEGVTEGPWIAEYSREQGNCVIPHDAESTREAVAVTRLYYQTADAKFIAAARTLVPELVAELKAVRAVNERLRAALPVLDPECPNCQCDARLRTNVAVAVDPTPLCPYGCDCGDCYGAVHEDRDCHCVELKGTSAMTARERLADALREHQRRVACNHPAYGHCHCGFNPEDDDELYPHEMQAFHVADVLLSLPGIAIVDLPEPVALPLRWDESACLGAWPCRRSRRRGSAQPLDLPTKICSNARWRLHHHQ